MAVCDETAEYRAGRTSERPDVASFIKEVAASRRVKHPIVSTASENRGIEDSHVRRRVAREVEHRALRRLRGSQCETRAVEVELRICHREDLQRLDGRLVELLVDE